MNELTHGEFFCIGSLGKSEMFGLELFEEMRKICDIALGSAFNLYHQLARKGYLKSRRGRAGINRGKSRVYYKVTSKGVKAFNERLRQYKKFREL